MERSFGSVNMNSFTILNDSSVEITFSSDSDGRDLGLIHFQGVTKIIYQAVLDDNQDCDPVHILEFVIHILDSKEINDFYKNFGFDVVPISLTPRFKVELRGSSNDISFFCNGIRLEKVSNFFDDLSHFVTMKLPNI